MSQHGSRRRPVVVALDPAADPRPAVRWAADEAGRRDAELEIVLAVDPAGTGPRADAVAAARAVAPGVPVTVRASRDPLLHAELRCAGPARLLVVPGPSARIQDLVSSTSCPTVVVPPDTALADAPGAPILLAAGPATGIEVVDFAFVEAAARGLPVLAVRCRPTPAAGLGRFLPWPVGAGENSHRDLAQQLSAWRVAYPDVRLETLVADEPAAAPLLSLAGHARLAVVGRPARGALLELLAASPARTLVRRVPCPVAVVPPRGVVRSSMLPSRPIRLADLRR